MGVTTPDGIGEKPKTEDLIRTEPADILYGPNEDVFQPDLDIEPLELLADTLQNFGEIAEENPNYASEMANALSEEIFEVFGLTENNPETLNPILESRVDDLAKAFKGNDPEEIKMATEALFNGAIDSPERLNQLAGYMLAQNGGHLAGLSVGNKNPWQVAQDKARRDIDRLGNATISMAAARALAENAANSVYDQNIATFEKAWEWARQNNHLSTQERASGMADINQDAIEDTIQAYMDANPDATYDDAKEYVLEHHEDNTATELGDKDLARAERVELAERMDGLFQHKQSLTLTRENTAMGAILGLGFGFSASDNPDAPSIETKQDLMNLINQQFLESGEQIAQSELELADIEELITAQEYRVNATRKEIMSNVDESTMQSMIDALEAEKTELATLREQLSSHREIIEAQKELSQIAETEIDRLLEGLNDDLSNLDSNYIKNALLNMDPALLKASENLYDKLDLEYKDPVQSLLEFAEAHLEENEYQEIVQFAQDLQTAQEALEYAQEWKASAERRLEFANQNSDFIAPTGLTSEFGSVADPIAPMNGSDFGFAMQEVENAFTILANLRAGTELEGEALQTAIYQEAILQEIGTDGVINQSEINQVFSGLGLYGDRLNDAQNSITAFLSDEHGVTVNADAPAKMDIQEAPEPESPEVIAQRMAFHKETEVWRAIEDQGMTSISKEDLMRMLEDAGISGEQLTISTEQLVADLQNEKGMDFVTGLEYPQIAAEEYNIGENNAPVVEEPAAPAEESPAVQPVNYDPEDPQYQNTGGAAPMV